MGPAPHTNEATNGLCGPKTTRSLSLLFYVGPNENQLFVYPPMCYCLFRYSVIYRTRQNT
ncbi:hypothetical protein BDV35DRAFT_372277 [Aspergillus flavus]|uniref:Uncharacterized protein n=1 Tax=Aspergillus flavus TaxID=5059 RepID=A0A5N6GEF8_ASPFL|nr:hypothetical protein BDV35DRAFT_372277 [Aspergillus flavus]